MPLELFIIMFHITKLRALVACGSNSKATVQHRMRKLFQQINDFTSEAWAEANSHHLGGLTAEIGHILQVATRLYGLLVFPQTASSGTITNTSTLPVQGVYDKLRIAQRANILERIRKIWPDLLNPDQLCWALIVTGVALADGDAEDRDFIAQCLLDTWYNELSGGTSFLIREKLYAFWKSGKTGWEDCFNEPVPW